METIEKTQVKCKIEKNWKNNTKIKLGKKVRKSRKIRTSYEPHYISNMQTTYKLWKLEMNEKIQKDKHKNEFLTINNKQCEAMF